MMLKQRLECGESSPGLCDRIPAAINGSSQDREPFPANTHRHAHKQANPHAHPTPPTPAHARTHACTLAYRALNRLFDLHATRGSQRAREKQNTFFSSCILQPREGRCSARGAETGALTDNETKVGSNTRGDKARVSPG